MWTKLIAGMKERGMFCGAPEDFLSQVEARKKAGVSQFYFQISDPKDKAKCRNFDKDPAR